MNCTRCGAALPPEQRFCGQCGQPCVVEARRVGPSDVPVGRDAMTPTAINHRGRLVIVAVTLGVIALGFYLAGDKQPEGVAPVAHIEEGIDSRGERLPARPPPPPAPPPRHVRTVERLNGKFPVCINETTFDDMLASGKVETGCFMPEAGMEIIRSNGMFRVNIRVRGRSGEIHDLWTEREGITTTEEPEWTEVVTAPLRQRPRRNPGNG